MKTKKSLKDHLMEIFFRRSFIDCQNKKEEVKKCFLHDLKIAGLFTLFLIILNLLVFIFGV